MATEFSISGKKLYVTSTGFKVGSRGKVQEAALIFADMSKSERRKLRKHCRSMGFTSHARS